MAVNKKLIGEHILDYFKININVVVVTIILLILAIILGKKYKDHIFAKIGSTLSIVLLSILIFVIGIDIIKTIIVFLF